MEGEVYGAILFRRQTVVCLPCIHFTILLGLLFAQEYNNLQLNNITSKQGLIGSWLWEQSGRILEMEKPQPGMAGAEFLKHHSSETTGAICKGTTSGFISSPISSFMICFRSTTRLSGTGTDVFSQISTSCGRSAPGRAPSK